MKIFLHIRKWKIVRAKYPRTITKRVFFFQFPPMLVHFISVEVFFFSRPPTHQRTTYN